MRKLSKLIAVVAAMALLMGMSTSAFAATSPADPDPEAVQKSIGTVTVSDPAKAGGGVVGVGIAKEDQITEAEAKDLVEGQLDITLKGNEKLVIMDAVELDYVKDGKVVNLDGDTITFTMKAPAGAKAGATVYVLHQMHDGSWEVLACTVDENGNITMTLTGLSPVYLAMIEQQQADTDAANKDGKSPKTGF